jgi:hypothetical protein
MPRNPLNPRGPYRKKLVRDQLLEKVIPDPSGSDCLLWIGARAGQMGYGVIGIDGANQYVHRVVYQISHGEIPPNLLVRHTCDNPRCCNPTHLVLGTHRDNTNDAVVRGRIALGEKTAAAKLTAEEVKTIKARLASGETHEAIAKDFRVARSSVTRIAIGTTWRHV